MKRLVGCLDVIAHWLIVTLKNILIKALDKAICMFIDGHASVFIFLHQASARAWCSSQANEYDKCSRQGKLFIAEDTIQITSRLVSGKLQARHKEVRKRTKLTRNQARHRGPGRWGCQQGLGHE